MHREAKRLLHRLEQHWQPHYRPEELHQRLTEMLLTIKRALAQDSADARLVVATHRRMLLQHETDPKELERADKALKRLLKSLGVVVVGLLPLSFITLPALFALAHHFGIELLPDENPLETKASG